MCKVKEVGDRLPLKWNPIVLDFLWEGTSIVRSMTSDDMVGRWGGEILVVEVVWGAGGQMAYTECNRSVTLLIL